MSQDSTNTEFRVNAWWSKLLVLFLLAILIINATDKISDIGYYVMNSKLSVFKEEYIYDFNITDY